MNTQDDNIKPEGNLPPANEEGKKAKKAKETVEIERSTLENILSKLDALEESNKSFAERDEKRDKEIEMLKSISDKARLARYEQQQNGGSLIRTAKIGIWESLPIIGWHKVKDEVGFRDGRLQVNQIIRIFLDEGKKEPKTVDLDYLYWVQNTTCISGEVINKNVSGNIELWTVQFKDGQKVILDTRFVNPF